MGTGPVIWAGHGLQSHPAKAPQDLVSELGLYLVRDGVSAFLNSAFSPPLPSSCPQALGTLLITALVTGMELDRPGQPQTSSL